MRSTNDVADETGLTYRQVDYLVRQDVLEPAQPGAMGVPRRFDDVDVAIVRVIADLMVAGYAGNELWREVVPQLRALERWDDRVLVVTQRRCAVIDVDEVPEILERLAGALSVVGLGGYR